MIFGGEKTQEKSTVEKKNCLLFISRYTPDLEIPIYWLVKDKEHEGNFLVFPEFLEDENDLLFVAMIMLILANARHPQIEENWAKLKTMGKFPNPNDPPCLTQ